MEHTIGISIVDDDEAVREALVGFMQAEGYTAQAYASAESFLASDFLQVTDCLIVDVNMPRMTGVELAILISKSKRPIPLILITARFNANILAKARQANVVCCLNKPFSDEDLVECVHTALEKRRTPH